MPTQRSDKRDSGGETSQSDLEPAVLKVPQPLYFLNSLFSLESLPRSAQDSPEELPAIVIDSTNQSEFLPSGINQPHLAYEPSKSSSANSVSSVWLVFRRKKTTQQPAASPQLVRQHYLC